MLNDRAIIYLALGQTLQWAGLFYIFPALFIRWEQAFPWSKPEITGAITIAIFISAIFSPLAGRIIDKGKGAEMMFAATILGGVSLFTLSYVTELIFFYLVWAVIGLCIAACLYEPCFALITRARGSQAKRGIIIVTLIAGFAGTLSFPTAHSITEISDWNTAVKFFALIIIFIAAPLTLKGARLLEKPTSSKNQKNKTDQSINHYEFVRKPAFWLLASSFAMIAILHGITIHHLLPILHDRGIQADVAVMAASFIGPMQVMGRLTMMAMEKQTSNHGVTISCFVVTACAIVLLFNSGSTLALLVGFVILFGAGYGIVSIIRPVITRDLLGEQNFGTKSGVLASIFLSGSALAPYLGAVIWSMGGYDLVLTVLIVVAAIGLCLYLLANRLVCANQV